MGKNGGRLRSRGEQKTNPFTGRNILIFACVFLLIFTALWLGNPELRAETFVLAFGDQIEATLESGETVTQHLFAKSVNTWEGEHSMTEFLLLTRGDTYYGCYYSPEDVPMAFQNADVTLTQRAADYWEWSDVGDNSGSTSRLFENWFYFEASF